MLARTWPPAGRSASPVAAADQQQRADEDRRQRISRRPPGCLGTDGSAAPAGPIARARLKVIEFSDGGRHSLSSTSEGIIARWAENAHQFPSAAASAITTAEEVDVREQPQPGRER